MKALTKGQTISYPKHIMFKGDITVTATIVAIYGTKILLDNGHTIYNITQLLKP